MRTTTTSTATWQEVPDSRLLRFTKSTMEVETKGNECLPPGLGRGRVMAPRLGVNVNDNPTAAPAAEGSAPAPPGLPRRSKSASSANHRLSAEKPTSSHHNELHQSKRSKSVPKSKHKHRSRRRFKLKEPPWLEPLSISGQPQSFPEGTDVQLRLRTNDYIRGIIFMDPIETLNGSTFRLTNARQVDSKGNSITGENVGITNFFRKDVVEVYVHKKGKIPETPEIGGALMTFVLKTKDQLKAALKVQKDHGITEIAVKFFFERLPSASKSDMKLIWIILCTKETIIPIDMDTWNLKDDPEVWDLLKSQIFENPEVVKIFHDSVLEISYLFHSKGITITNHYDTKTGVYFMENRLREPEPSDEKPAKNTTKTDHSLSLSLATCLQRYLPQIVPVIEIEFLNLVEKYHFSPTAARANPSPEMCKFMALTVKYLGSLKTEIENRLLKNLTVAMESQVKITQNEMRAVSNTLRKLPREHWRFVRYLAKPETTKVPEQFE